MFSSAQLVFLHFFFVIVYLNFMSHFYDILFQQYVVFLCHYLLLKLIVFIIFKQNQSVCMFTLIFCVGTWLFSTS